MKKRVPGQGGGGGRCDEGGKGGGEGRADTHDHEQYPVNPITSENQFKLSAPRKVQ